MNMPTQRSLKAVIPSEAAMEGAGVQIRRAIGSQRLPEVDPFLLLDEIHSDDPNAYLAGFPAHPHRGLETVTYMLSGQMRHRDSTGSEGTITTGDVQWMTTGKGIIHSEMPGQANGLMWGFQLWVNLPAREKMRDPEYVELKADQIPEVNLEHASVRVLSGTWGGVDGPAPKRSTAPLILDVRVQAGGRSELSLPSELSGIVFVYRGEALVGTPARKVNAKAVGVLDTGDSLVVASDDGVGLLVVAGIPLDEPIARAGPFVMNTQAELVQAFQDYQAGRLAAPIHRVR